MVLKKDTGLCNVHHVSNPNLIYWAMFWVAGPRCQVLLKLQCTYSSSRRAINLWVRSICHKGIILGSAFLISSEGTLLLLVYRPHLEQPVCSHGLDGGGPILALITNYLWTKFSNHEGSHVKAKILQKVLKEYEWVCMPRYAEQGFCSVGYLWHPHDLSHQSVRFYLLLLPHWKQTWSGHSSTV